MAEELRAQGHKVSLVKRTEGNAYRISKIDGRRFKGSAGNIEARAILGESLTVAQEEHMRRIKHTAHTFGKAKKDSISKEMESMQRKINRAFKKIGQSARVTRAKIRYRLKTEGEKETLKYLERALNYAKGYTHTESLEGYIQRLEADNRKINSWDVEQVIEGVKNVIKEGKHLQEPNFQELKDLTYEWEEKRGTPLAMKDSTFRHRALMIINRAE